MRAYAIVGLFLLAACTDDRKDAEKVEKATETPSLAMTVYEKKLDCAVSFTTVGYLDSIGDLGLNGVQAASNALREAEIAGEAAGFTEAKVQADLKKLATVKIKNLDNRPPEETLNALLSELKACER